MFTSPISPKTSIAGREPQARGRGTLHDVAFIYSYKPARLIGVGQASSESISCLLPEMAVAMPKILHFTIFGTTLRRMPTLSFASSLGLLKLVPLHTSILQHTFELSRCQPYAWVSKVPRSGTLAFQSLGTRVRFDAWSLHRIIIA